MCLKAFLSINYYKFHSRISVMKALLKLPSAHVSEHFYMSVVWWRFIFSMKTLCGIHFPFILIHRNVFFKPSFSLRVFIITEFSEFLSARWGLSHFQNVVLSLWGVDYSIFAFLTCLFVWWDKQFLAGDSQVICTNSILRVHMKWRYLLWCV